MDSDYYLSGLFDQVTIQALTAGPVIALSLAILLLLVSGFVSASEVAFFSLTPGDINDIREENAPSDPLIQRLLDRSEYLLAAILIANNFVNVAVVMLCTYGINAIVDFSSAPMLGFILETIVLTFLLLLFGEIMPKIYAQKNSLRFVRSSAPVLNVVERVCRPLSNILVTSTSVINKALVKKKYDLSVDELSKALELTSTEMPEEKEMLSEIIKFYNKTADEIMTPRLDMEDIDIKTSFRTVVDFIIRSGYSRIPVYADSEDNIKGILYIKDLLPYVEKPDTFRWQSLIRPAYFVPETKKIDDLLEEFRTSKIHMAIVVDEFGGTSGIVTMEDILEEIVGEIAQCPFNGQASQSGFCGTHCKAPNSIIAWLCCPAYRGSITKPASSVKAFFPLGVSIGVSTANRRESTRKTFPSTTGYGWFHTKETMAAAVYSPIPFKEITSS